MMERQGIIRHKDRFRFDILAIIFLVIVTTILFLPVLMKWQGIFHNDQAMSESLRHYFFAGNLRKGIIPLWNPHVWCGAIPYYASIYPVEIFYLFLWPLHFFANPSNLDLTYLMVTILPLLFHYILAAIGMFVLLKGVIECNTISAFIGAFTYIYSPAFTYSYVSENNLIMQSWLPWLIYVYISALKKWRLWKLLWAGIILAIIWIAGKPQYMPFIIIVWVGFVLLSMFINVYSKRKTDFIKPFLLAFMIFILGTALSAIYLYPLIESFKYTQLHMNLSLDGSLADSASNLPLFYLTTLFVPNFFGNITGEDFIFKRLMFWYANMSAGMATTLMVILGILIPSLIFSKSAQNKHYHRYAILGIFLYLFSVLCSLGANTPLYRLFIGWMPIVGVLPFPIRYRMIQCFAASLLISIGLNYLISPKFSILRYKLQRLVWLYIVFSLFIICIVLFLPTSSEKEQLWLGEQDSKIEDFFSQKEPVGVYTPKTARVKKIRVIFNGESEGEIRYSDSHKIFPGGGIFVKGYRSSEKGWVEFDVDIPPNKFLWIYPKRGSGGIGSWSEQRHCFTYSAYNNNWEIRPHINAIGLYQGIAEGRTSLFYKLKKDYIVKMPVVTSCLYWLLVSFVIIICVNLLPPNKFGYLLGAIILIEFFVFGMMAFYGCTFNEDKTSDRAFLPHNIRALRPSEHPMLQHMLIQVSTVANDSMLRIAADYPFYDNFVYLNKRFALMGEPPFPMEKRFKRAIGAAYGQDMDWIMFYEGGGCFPRSTAFLSNFSVGYFLTSSRKKVFSRGRCIPLMDNSDLFIHINHEVLPRIYTLDRIVTVSEEEQMRRLVWDDLRKAVYINPKDGMESNGELENYISHFNTLQQKNLVKKMDFNNPNQIDINIDVAIPSMLVFTEVWYPGWKATVDGRPTKVQRVNYCQRSIWLEKGNHYVQMRFQPFAWQIGMNISLGTMASMAGSLMVSKMKRRNKTNIAMFITEKIP